MSVNKIILVGNVGKDPKVRHLEGDLTVASFTLATNETYKKNGERVTDTEWHNITLWRGLAQVAENYVKKGSQLYIEGKVKTKTYDDKEGVKRYFTEVIADKMQMLDRKGDNGGEKQQTQTPAPAPEHQSQPAQGQEDLPF